METLGIFLDRIRHVELGEIDWLRWLRLAKLATFVVIVFRLVIGLPVAAIALTDGVQQEGDGDVIDAVAGELRLNARQHVDDAVFAKVVEDDGVDVEFSSRSFMK